MQCEIVGCSGSAPCTICALTNKLCRSCSIAYHFSCKSTPSLSSLSSSPSVESVDDGFCLVYPSSLLDYSQDDEVPLDDLSVSTSASLPVVGENPLPLTPDPKRQRMYRPSASPLLLATISTPNALANNNNSDQSDSSSNMSNESVPSVLAKFSVSNKHNNSKSPLPASTTNNDSNKLSFWSTDPRWNKWSVVTPSCWAGLSPSLKFFPSWPRPPRVFPPFASSILPVGNAVKKNDGSIFGAWEEGVIEEKRPKVCKVNRPTRSAKLTRRNKRTRQNQEEKTSPRFDIDRMRVYKMPYLEMENHVYEDMFSAMKIFAVSPKYLRKKENSEIEEREKYSYEETDEEEELKWLVRSMERSNRMQKLDAHLYKGDFNKIPCHLHSVHSMLYRNEPYSLFNSDGSLRSAYESCSYSSNESSSNISAVKGQPNWYNVWENSEGKGGIQELYTSFQEGRWTDSDGFIMEDEGFLSKELENFTKVIFHLFPLSPFVASSAKHSSSSSSSSLVPVHANDGCVPRIFCRSNLTSFDYDRVHEVFLRDLSFPNCVCDLVFCYFKDNLAFKHWQDGPDFQEDFDFTLSQFELSRRGVCPRYRKRVNGSASSYLNVDSAWPVMRDCLLDEPFEGAKPYKPRKSVLDKPEFPKFDFTLPKDAASLFRPSTDRKMNLDDFLCVESAWPVFAPDLIDNDRDFPPVKPFPKMSVCVARMKHLAVMLEECSMFTRRKRCRNVDQLQELNQYATAFLQACQRADERFQACLKQPIGYVEPHTVVGAEPMLSYTDFCQWITPQTVQNAQKFLARAINRSCRRREMSEKEKEQAIQHSQLFVSNVMAWPEALRECQENWDRPVFVPPPQILRTMREQQCLLARQQIEMNGWCPFCYKGANRFVHSSYFDAKNCRALSLRVHLRNAPVGSYDILP